ncbi:MAG: tetratricopeptide repeat protein [Leptolyngbyaceae cyanobacterium]
MKNLWNLCLSLCLAGLISVTLLDPGAIASETTDTLTQTEIQTVAELREKALITSQEGDLAAADRYWSKLLDLLPQEAAIWSNRGLIRTSQERYDEALADYTEAITLAPTIPDPYLNRGAVYEVLQDWDAAIADYDQVLEIDPQEAGAYNNRGNAKGGLGDWQGAIADYQQAANLDANFALARVNTALALYQTGEQAAAIKSLRGTVRKYPNFPDARAALTGMLWQTGQQGEAESHWVAVLGLDTRYRKLDWVRQVRRWPPAVADALAQFLAVEG